MFSPQRGHLKSKSNQNAHAEGGFMALLAKYTTRLMQGPGTRGWVIGLSAYKEGVPLVRRPFRHLQGAGDLGTISQDMVCEVRQRARWEEQGEGRASQLSPSTPSWTKGTSWFRSGSLNNFIWWKVFCCFKKICIFWNPWGTSFS